MFVCVWRSGGGGGVLGLYANTGRLVKLEFRNLQLSQTSQIIERFFSPEKKMKDVVHIF